MDVVSRDSGVSSYFVIGLFFKFNVLFMYAGEYWMML